MEKFTNKLDIGPDCFEIFLTSDNLPEMPLYHIHMAGIAQLQPPYQVERSDSTIHTLLFTSSGQGKLLCDQGEQIIGADTLTVIPANLSFRFEINAEHWHMCWVLLPDNDNWRGLIPKQATIRASQQALNILHLSHLIDQERQLAPQFRRNSFAQLARYLEWDLKAEAALQSNRLDVAFAQVEQSLHKAWTVADIAALSYYSQPHLYRLCKARFGIGPKQVIRRLRIERAKQLLSHTDWSLAELAQRLGFSDQFNFSTRFKKDVGISPMAFRQRALRN
jgi:AraC-like DNA-binding protein